MKNKKFGIMIKGGLLTQVVFLGFYGLVLDVDGQLETGLASRAFYEI